MGLAASIKARWFGSPKPRTPEPAATPWTFRLVGAAGAVAAFVGESCRVEIPVATAGVVTGVTLNYGKPAVLELSLDRAIHVTAGDRVDFDLFDALKNVNARAKLGAVVLAAVAAPPV